MAWDIQTLFSGRSPTDGDRPSDTVRFVVIGDPGSDESEGLTALRSAAPATLGTLKLTECRITDRIIDGPNGTYLLGEAQYASGNDAKDKETGESSFAFDTTGGTFKILISKETTGHGAATGFAPDLKGVIGATTEGADGTEITVPQYAFQETHYLAAAAVTDAYKGVLFALTGTTNSGAFKGLNPGECLFLGARGSKRGRGDWEITFNFAASPNVTGLTVGDISGVEKLGWEYLWVWYQKKTVGTGANKVLVPVPQYLYTERVYDAGNHALLGIGTT